MALAGFLLVAVVFFLVVRSEVKSSAPDSLARGSLTPVPGSLADLAADRGITFGSAVNSAGLSDSLYGSLLREQFAMITPETEMKWAALEPANGSFTFDAADALVDRAVADGQEVRGHTLVWHRSVPDWVVDGDFDREQLREILRTYIFTVVGHYKGRVSQWDVVNEVVADDGSLRKGIWLDTIGPSYIDDAFRWAHEADPSAELYLNEVGAETSKRKSDAIMKLIDDLQSRDVPIDGLGYEAHQTEDFDSKSLAVFKSSVSDAASRELKVALTELDVRVKVSGNGSYDSEKQEDVYRSIVGACVAQPACKTIVVWGFTDAYSWVPERYPGWGGATLYDSSYNPKGARAAVASALT